MICVVKQWGGNCVNASTTFSNDSVDNSILDGEGISCSIISIPSFEKKIDNDHIHLLHDLPKRIIYIYLISKLISSQATVQSTILKKICPLLRWGDLKESREIKKRKYYWYYQLILISHKRIHHEFYIEIMGITTKTYTILEVAIYTSLQRSICHFMMLHKKL